MYSYQFASGDFAATLTARTCSEHNISMFSSNKSKHAGAANTTTRVVQHCLLHLNLHRYLSREIEPSHFLGKQQIVILQ